MSQPAAVEILHDRIVAAQASLATANRILMELQIAIALLDQQGYENWKKEVQARWKAQDLIANT